MFFKKKKLHLQKKKNDRKMNTDASEFQVIRIIFIIWNKLETWWRENISQIFIFFLLLGKDV